MSQDETMPTPTGIEAMRLEVRQAVQNRIKADQATEAAFQAQVEGWIAFQEARLTQDEAKIQAAAEAFYATRKAYEEAHEFAVGSSQGLFDVLNLWEGWVDEQTGETDPSEEAGDPDGYGE